MMARSNMHMIHHISFSVSDLERSSRFYDAITAALGFRQVYSSEKFIGYGIEDKEDKFAIVAKTPNVTPPSPGFHLAFSASSRAAVQMFYQAATENGGEDNGGPGLRPHYGPNYYAAFVVDPDGYRIEAVYNGKAD
jgi:catechol 2,3-dioxygenase-like lactoylglutathione lyase family enzyme